MLRHAVFAELCPPFRLQAAHARGAPFIPPHTQIPESRPRRPLVIFLGVGGVPHQLGRGGSKDSVAQSRGVAGTFSTG